MCLNDALNNLAFAFFAGVGITSILWLLATLAMLTAMEREMERRASESE